MNLINTFKPLGKIIHSSTIKKTISFEFGSLKYIQFLDRHKYYSKNEIPFYKIKGKYF